jgi:L-iditol 2-dehydrogenase
VQCSSYDYLGSRRNGAFAEYVAVPRQNLIRLPDSVSLEEAALTEPAAVALHALRRAGGSLIGETVAIFGAGPIGLMVAQWARAMGAADVALFDVVPRKIELSRQLGFESVFDGRTVDPEKAIAGLKHGQGANVSIEAAGVPETMRQALAVTRRGGRVVLLGNPAKDVSLPLGLISQVMRREITIHGTWNSEYSFAGEGDDWHTALDAMAKGTLRVKPLITHRVALARAFDALRMMRDQTEFFAKVVIEPGAR